MIPSLVSCEWLNEKITSGNLGDVVILDVSWTSDQGTDDYDKYRQKHIPGARYLNVLDAEHTEYLVRNLPTAERFTELCRAAGVKKSSHIVLYSSSMLAGFFMSGRAWWTFRVFGFTNISILDGGLARWEKQGFEVTSELPQITAGDFEAVTPKSLYKTYEDVTENLKTNSFQVVDSRSPDLYKESHIPGALNLCTAALVDNDQMKLKSDEELRAAFSKAGIDLSKPVVAHCKGGMSSTTIALLAERLGQKDIAVFHGGFTEWTKRQALQTPTP